MCQLLGDIFIVKFQNVYLNAVYLFFVSLGLISQTDLSLASYHFVLDLSPKIDLSLFMKLALG